MRWVCVIARVCLVFVWSHTSVSASVLFAVSLCACVYMIDCIKTVFACLCMRSDSCANDVLCVYLYACLPVGLSVFFVCLPIHLSDCLSVYLSICLSACLSVCLPAYQPVCLSVCLSAYLSAYRSV